jgi:hypothetical protein
MSDQVEPMLPQRIERMFLALGFVFFGLIAIFAPRLVRFFHSFWPTFGEETLRKVSIGYRIAAIILAIGVAIQLLQP